MFHECLPKFEFRQAKSEDFLLLASTTTVTLLVHHSNTVDTVTLIRLSELFALEDMAEMAACAWQTNSWLAVQATVCGGSERSAKGDAHRNCCT
jgi:hypothetical protein